MEKLKVYMDKYEECFGDSFPAFCFIHLAPDEIIEVIDDCLTSKRDVYAMGILSDEPDVRY